MLRSAIFLATSDAAHLMRRRETWIWAFVLPIVFFYFIGTITAHWSSSGETKDTLAVFVAPGAGPLSDSLLRHLEALDYKVVKVPSETALANFERTLAIPGNFTTGILARTPVTVKFSHKDSGIGGDYDSIRLQRASYTLLGDLVVLTSLNQPVTPAAIDALDSAPRPTRLTTRPAGRRNEVPSGFEQAVPGSMVFFILLVLLSSGGASLVAEREQGILRRLASSPMSRGAVVLGKWGARMMLGVVQIAFCMLTGSLLFHVRWGHYLGVVVVVLLCYAAFATSSGMLLASLSRTRGQAGAFGSLVANVLACVGGCWWPAEIMPRFVQAISRLTPPGMTMDALHQLVNFGSGPGAAAPQIITLAALALIIGFFAARNFRFQ